MRRNAARRCGQSFANPNKPPQLPRLSQLLQLLQLPRLSANFATFKTFHKFCENLWANRTNPNQSAQIRTRRAQNHMSLSNPYNSLTYGAISNDPAQSYAKRAKPDTQSCKSIQINIKSAQLSNNLRANSALFRHNHAVGRRKDCETSKKRSGQMNAMNTADKIGAKCAGKTPPTKKTPQGGAPNGGGGAQYLRQSLLLEIIRLYIEWNI